jgi:cell division septation protein DedD
MVHKYLVAVAILGGVAASPLPAQTVRTGIEAWQRADYERAVAIWRPLAERGDQDAAFNLGQAYRLGRGVSISLGAAKTWFERAAVKGHLDAQTTLGLMLFENGDRSGGLRWLRVAAEKGEPRALLVYGTALFNGDGTKRDPLLGYAYVSRAAAQGLLPAQSTLEQLDQILPLDQRKKAVAVAMAKAKATPPPRSKPASTPRKAAVPAAAPAKPAIPVAAAPSAVPAGQASGPWRIQLGAFSQRGAAEGLFRKLSGALPGKRAFYVPAGAVTRLQVGPFATRAAASAACSGLSGRGQACFPVTVGSAR